MILQGTCTSYYCEGNINEHLHTCITTENCVRAKEFHYALIAYDVTSGVLYWSLWRISLKLPPRPRHAIWVLLFYGSKKYGTKHLLSLLFEENQLSGWQDTKKMKKDLPVKTLS